MPFASTRRLLAAAATGLTLLGTAFSTGAVAQSTIPQDSAPQTVAPQTVAPQNGTGQSTGAQHPQAGLLRRACGADYRALCPGVQPGGGRIIACFRQHADKLSQNCRNALETARANRAAQSPSSGTE